MHIKIKLTIIFLLGLSSLGINQRYVKANSISASQVIKSTNSNPNTDTQAQKKTSDHASQSNQNGWKNENGKKLYFKNNKKLKGLKKISGKWYLFDKNGYSLTNLRKIPHTNSYGFFNNEGVRQFKNVSTFKSSYWISKNGNVIGIKNKAKVIRQLPEMPTGCEITAVTMMINFAGKNITKQEAAKIMPRSLNPNKGFIGSPYKNFPLGFWVAPGGVKPVVEYYLGKAKIMTGCSINAIKQKLIRQHLVVVWVGQFDGISNHALALTGYHNNTIYYNDPWTGTKRKMSISTFNRHWALDGHRAISY